MAVSDFQINSMVRSVLARHLIDLRQIEFGSCRGTVRFKKYLVPLGGPTGKLSRATLERLETEVAAIRGVNRIYFELENWRHGDAGHWTHVGDSFESQLVESSRELATAGEGA